MKKTLLGALCSLLLWFGSAHAQIVAVVGLDQVEFESAAEGQQLPDDVSAVGDEILAALGAELLATRKFKVLDRNVANSILDEHGLDIDTVTSDDNAETLYDVPGLDYVLNAKINQYNAETGGAVVSLGLRSTSFPLDSQRKEITVKPAEDSTDDGNLKESITKSILFKTIATVFPIRVMDMDTDGFVTLNYGQGILSPGTHLEVFAPVDAPNNGAVEAGEVRGTPVAVLEVTNSDEKFATARVREGMEDLKLGFKVAPLDK